MSRPADRRADRRAEATVAAVDLGASSGRVVVGHCSPLGFRLHEVHRFANVPVRVDGVLRWDVLALFQGILDGLRAAVRQAGPLDAIGVDGWGVDYGLLDADGQLLGNPVHYRDAPTRQAVADVLAEVGAPALYDATGIQLQPFNTLFQLLAQRESAQFGIAAHALLIPDLMAYWLGGALGTELTNASTTGLLDPRTLRWAAPLTDRLGVPVGLLPALRAPGEPVGSLRSDLLGEVGLTRPAQLITVPSHDTAAAVAGIPAEVDDFAFVCTGTWALVGLELPAPVITEQSRAANFTNEVGIDGTIRFLRNVTGFWLLQECVREWRAAGHEVDLNVLTEAAARIPPLRALIDVQDPAFAAPGDMPRRIAEACLRTSGIGLTGRAETVRCILDSMAVAIRHAVRDAVRLAGRPVRVVHVVGGGVSNPLFCQLIADACGLPVIAGPTEAASWGNVMSQARALGIGGESLAEARSIIRAAQPPTRYEVRTDSAGTVGTTEQDWERADSLLAAAAGARSVSA
jgi:rhamnulokinase